MSDSISTARALHWGRRGLPLVLLCVLPFYLDAFWLRIGLFSLAAAIGPVLANSPKGQGAERLELLPCRGLTNSF